MMLSVVMFAACDNNGPAGSGDPPNGGIVTPGNGEPGNGGSTGGLTPIPDGTSQDIDATGLEAWWHTGDITGGVIADRSGSNRPLTVVGNTNQMAGVAGSQAFRLDGQSALTFAPDRYILADADMTIAFWLNIQGFTPPYDGANLGFGMWQNTIMDVEGAIAAMFTEFLITVSLIWDIDSPSVVSLRATAAGQGGPLATAGQDALLTDATHDINFYDHRNEWIHVAIVWQNAIDFDNPGTITIYLNGATNEHRVQDMFHGDGGPKMIGNPTQDPAWAARTTIGAWIDDGANVRRGGLFALDDMRIYTRAISSQEAMSLAMLHNS